MGRCPHYQDTTSDPENNILNQVTKVDMVYNRKGQMLTQTTSVHADMKGAGWSDSSSTMALSYDDRFGASLGGDHRIKFNHSTSRRMDGHGPGR
jgi:hypothetical protein